MLWCYTCKLATRLPSGFCPSETDELLWVFLWMLVSICLCLGVCLGLFVWRGLLLKAKKCNQYSVSYKIWKSLLASVHDSLLGVKNMSPTGSQSKASVFWSLPPQKPKYSLIIFKVFQLYLTASKKGFTEMSSGWRRNLCFTVKLKGRVDIALTECRRHTGNPSIQNQWRNIYLLYWLEFIVQQKCK